MDFIDQMNRTIRLEQRPRRIVSLVPSQSELLFELGLGKEVVGITKFCIHPEEWFKNKTRIGGTKNIDIQKISELKPDFIIGNKEENTLSDIEQLEQIAPVWMSDIYNLTDALEMILLLGNIFGKLMQAIQITDNVQLSFNTLKLQKFDHRKVLYFIWKDPYLLAGKETFIDAMLTISGFDNCCKESRYPELNLDITCSPDLILLSTEPYPFKEQHCKELKSVFPDAEVLLVDGEMFSWYGSRLQKSAAYIANLQKSLNSGR